MEDKFSSIFNPLLSTLSIFSKEGTEEQKQIAQWLISEMKKKEKEALEIFSDKREVKKGSVKKKRIK